MKHTVNVCGTSGIVSGKDGLEIDDAVVIRLLDSTEEGRVQVVGSTVTVATGLDARIDTLLVTVKSVVRASRIGWSCRTVELQCQRSI
jgi:hypothetical protein